MKLKRLVLLYGTLLAVLCSTVSWSGEVNAQPVVSSLPSTGSYLPSRSSSSTSLYLPAVTSTFNSSCHFGVGVVLSPKGYDLSALGVGAHLNWGSVRDSSIAQNIQYFPVLRVSDNAYAATLQTLPDAVKRNLHAVWMVGNEPDAAAPYQDHIAAEVYAERFYALATQIRALDATAKIGFGTIIQPTPVRMYYLQKVLDRLTQSDLAGSKAKALALIDIYTIHNFILNERPQDWGAEVPVGYDAASWPAPETITVLDGVGDETWKTYDINTFEERVIRVRQWMKDNGDQNKPLWITEYGSLLPPESTTMVTVSNQDTATYMYQTFDYMLSHKDPTLGYPDDDNRLVQQWVWYSLNDYVDQFGGSFFDPRYHSMTYVGHQFIQYDPPPSAVPLVPSDVFVVPNSLSVKVMNQSITPGSITYQVSVKISNGVSTDYLTGVKVDLYDGSDLVGSVEGNAIRCSGTTTFSFIVPMAVGSTHTFKVQTQLLASYGTDVNLKNNMQTFNPITLSGHDHFVVVPLVLR